MNAVGIDISKGKCTVAILKPLGEVVADSFEVHHTSTEIKDLINRIHKLEGNSKVVMEHTGRYYEPVAHKLTESGLFVSVVNPVLIKNYGDDSLHTPKTDKADARKIASYTLDKWNTVKQYNLMDELRIQLKTMNRQFEFYTTHKTALKNNLIALLDQTFPGSNDFFDSPVRKDGHQKWVDFAGSYWHVDCVNNKSLEKFKEHYQKWCKRNGYNYLEAKAEAIYATSIELIPILPKNEITKGILLQAVNQLKAMSKEVEELRMAMDQTASKLPEYQVVMSMGGVGHSLGPQLMAELGDVRRFTHRSAITAYAGVDPGGNDSGKHQQKSVRTTKRGSAHLRRTLFLVMSSLIKLKPDGDPVYTFMMKKKAEGKPYLVYMTAGANKFLRIYYGTVKAYYAKCAEEE